MALNLNSLPKLTHEPLNSMQNWKLNRASWMRMSYVIYVYTDRTILSRAIYCDAETGI